MTTNAKIKNTPKYDKKHKQKNTTREHRRPRFLADRFWGFGRLLKVLDVSRLYFGRLGQVLKVLKGFKLRLLRAQGDHYGPLRCKNVMLLYRGPKLASLMKKGRKNFAHGGPQLTFYMFVFCTGNNTNSYN